MLTRIATVFTFIVIVIISVLSDTKTIIIPFSICCFIVYISKKKYRGLFVNSFLFYSIIGSFTYYTYYMFCANTFAPYHDDSYYFKNVQTLLIGDFSSNNTLYEYVLAVCAVPFNFFWKVHHVDLLPINWLLGAFCVTKSVEFANKVVPVKGTKGTVVGALFILLNSSFIEGTVHLYRDPLMSLLFITSLDYIFYSYYKKGILFAIFTGFVRGANGLILFFYFAIIQITKRYRLKRSNILILLVVTIFLIPLTDRLFHYDSLLRGFSGGTSQTISLSESISERFEVFRGDEVGGVMSLIVSENPFLNLMAMPVYMISPLKAQSFIVSEDYIVRDEASYYVVRFRLESLWQLVSITFTSFFLCRLFLGLYSLCREKDVHLFILFILFVLMLASVTYISMQHRHKMMFIMLYPLLSNCFENKYTYNKKITIISLFFCFVFFIYNFY